MPGSLQKLVVSLILSSLAVVASADDEPAAAPGANECREISNAEERLQCYDREATATEVDAAPAGSEQVETLQGEDNADEFGLPDEDISYQSVRVTIASCGEASNRIFYFNLDNGQIWKYLGNKRLRYRDCNLDATITEDSFGHSLRVDGETRKLRVIRLK